MARKRTVDICDPKCWSFNKSDEHAISEGCIFDPLAGSYPVWWIERFCKLYQGEQGGEPLLLRMAPKEPPELSDPGNLPREWSNESDECIEWSAARAQWYLEHKHARGICDWQYEFIMRFFGWRRWSDRWQRWIRRFRTGSVYIPKKNKKSPTMSAVGLYVAFGDGEPGNQVFFGAKNGNQARKIAGEHVFAMVRQSAELSEYLKINRNTYRVLWEERGCWIEPLSSSNERTQQSQEGLNGSLLIDETHVVDRQFMDIVSRCGISRSEPIHLEFSTAGDDIDSYGYDRWEYTDQVLSGEITDSYHFGMIFAADQNLKIEAMAKDPLKYGQIANPAWGHTIDPDEFLADFNRSKATEKGWRTFRRYRLNIWSDTPETYLDPTAWQACGMDYTWEDMAGLGGGAGLDLSRVDDFTAAAFVAKHPGYQRVLVWPIVWVPDETVERLAEKVPQIIEWKNDGFLRAIPGNVVDYELVENDLVEAIKHVKTKTLCYDPTFANQLAQQLEKRARVTAAAMQQTFGVYAGPTDEVSRMVIAGELGHPRHPVLNWQARNAQVAEYAGRRKPVKDKMAKWRKIDLIQALVMATHGYTLTPGSAKGVYSGSATVQAC